MSSATRDRPITTDMPRKASGGSGKYKPHRVVRIPERFAKLLEKLAEEDFDTLASQVRKACRDRLIARGKLPRPSAPPD